MKLPIKKVLTSLLCAFIFGAYGSLSACQFPFPSNSGSDSFDASLEDDVSNDIFDDSSNSSSDDSSSIIPDDSSESEINEEHVSIVEQAYAIGYGETLGDGYTLTGYVTRIDAEYNSGSVCLTFAVPGIESKPIYCYKLQGEGADLIRVGDKVTVYGRIKNYRGTVEFDKNCLLVEYESDTVIPDDGDDPYAHMTKAEFYANYTVAKDNTDAYYRSKNGFLSGELTVPDQAPTLSAYRPKSGNSYVRNSEMLLSADGNTYTVVDAYGEPVFNVYRDGAYITLEEVAAYVYAFGTYPKNHSASKNATPSSSIWGEYLRLNHTQFSGDTRKYPYEPQLPNITGCGGSLKYWEMDIGTTGTDCDPSYPAALYNNGYRIDRGAARIVYGKTDLNGNGVYEIGEFHVFYTYNHYNDFQEYLNYQGGWGEKFGNITGGGTISSKYDYNPTNYVEVALQKLPSTLLNG